MIITGPDQSPLISGTNIQSINGSSILTSGNLITSYPIVGAALLGSSIKAEPIGMSYMDITTTNTLTDGITYYVGIYLPQSATIVGVMWYQAVQGNYTSDNNNKVGLYTYSGGTLNLVASSNDDGTMWKATSNTWATKAFSGTYPASPGIYFIGFLYNSSAQVAAPALGSATNLTNLAVVGVDFTNSAKMIGQNSVGTTDLPGSRAMSGVSALANRRYVALY